MYNNFPRQWLYELNSMSCEHDSASVYALCLFPFPSCSLWMPLQNYCEKSSTFLQTTWWYRDGVFFLLVVPIPEMGGHYYKKFMKDEIIYRLSRSIIYTYLITRAIQTIPMDAFTAVATEVISMRNIWYIQRWFHKVLKVTRKP